MEIDEQTKLIVANSERIRASRERVLAAAKDYQTAAALSKPFEGRQAWDTITPEGIGALNNLSRAGQELLTAVLAMEDF